MANYTPTGNPPSQTRGIASLIRNEFVLLQNAISTKANLDLPNTFVAAQTFSAAATFSAGGTFSGGTYNFTGSTITAATATPLTNSTLVATTAYADAAVAAEATLRISNDALKANINSPTFTGTPTAPTPNTLDNSTTLATTAYVRAALSSGTVIGAASTIREARTATASQTVFNLTNSYVTNTNSIRVFINGVYQFPGTYTETSSNVVTFSDPLTAGDAVLFEIGVITSGTTQSAATVAFNPTVDVPDTNAQAAIANLLPAQATNAGRFLTTNGTTKSWANVIGTVTFANRATLRSTIGSAGQYQYVESLGLFQWVAGSTEPDDDETCFAATGGRWELAAADPDYVYASTLPEIDAVAARADALELTRPAVLRATFTQSATSVSSGFTGSNSVTVIGAAIGDSVVVTANGNITYGTVNGYVSAANTVTVFLSNPCAAAATFPAGTWVVSVIKQS